MCSEDVSYESTTYINDPIHALQVIRKLKQNPNCEISETESLCVQLAGLCHDLGHGPFSHSWEQYVQEKTGEKYEHENMSIQLFDYLIRENKLNDSFQRYGIDEEHRKFIKDLILGKPAEYKTLKPKSYLFEIVANKQNGLDIDKYEYLMRDSYFFGIKIDPNFGRYLTGIRIIEDGDKNEHIGYRDKLESHIISIFKQRAEMHDKAYKHKVCLRIETM
uniref:HD_domain domain-containing protein n=1 Tax=Rhodnius prolixus TaxID=13249 RepID=T1IBN1_RHOPR